MKKKLPRKRVKTITAVGPLTGIWEAIAKSIAESYNLPKRPQS
ncbi:hypothetical protein [Spirosoma aerophilum]